MNKQDWFKDLYDYKWLGFYETFFSPKKTTKEVNFFIKASSIKKQDRILDLCCGYGRHTIELAKRGYQVIGFDYSFDFLKKAKKDAKKAGLKIPFIQGDIRQLAYDNEFDVILMSSSAAFYFDDLEIKKVFIKLNKALNSGGRILIDTARSEKIFKDFKEKGKRINKSDSYKLEENSKIDNVDFHFLRILNFKKQVEKLKFKIPSDKKHFRHIYFRHFLEKQLKDMLLGVGFKTQSSFGDYDSNLTNESSERTIIMAKKIIIPDIINSIKKVRKERFKVSDFTKATVLINKAKSINYDVRKEALNYLNLTWGTKDIESIKKAKKVDLLKEFERFSFKERKLILKNLYALELIRGCTGGCYFCASGLKTKVEEKFSFSSLKKFYKKYHYFIPRRNDYFDEIRRKLLKRFPKQYKYMCLGLPEEREVFTYWDCDPFLFEDGKFSFIDIYKLMVNYGRGRFSRHISTSIPPGSPKNFVIFFEKIAKDYCQRNIKLPLVRISLAKHNIQRVEATLTFLYHYLLSDGFPQEKINELYKKSLIFHIRDEETLFKAGPLINWADEFSDILSPQCQDGFVISPDNSRIEMMISTNRYSPSGALTMPLNRKNFYKNIIPYNSLYNYAYFMETTKELYDPYGHLLHLRRLALKGRIFLSFPKEQDNFKIIPDNKKRIFYFLSRYSLSLRHFLEYLAQLNMFDFPKEDKNNFFIAAEKDFERLQFEILDCLKKAKRFGNIKGKKELSYLIALLKFYLKQVELIMFLIKEEKEPDFIIKMANTLLKLKKKDNKNLDKIIKNIMEKNKKCIVEVEGLNKTFDKNEVLKNVNFKISEGETFGIVGPNGAGKTVLLNILLGLISPESGKINIFNKDLKENSKSIREEINFASSYVPLFPDIDVISNLKIFSMLYNNKIDLSKINYLINFFGLKELANSKKRLQYFSSGEKARVSLAKSLINNPKILLLDEATASLDSDMASKLIRLLKKIQKDNKMTIIYTTHRLEELKYFKGTVCHLEKGRIKSIEKKGSKN